jgi:hypothetical protein
VVPRFDDKSEAGTNRYCDTDACRDAEVELVSGHVRVIEAGASRHVDNAARVDVQQSARRVPASTRIDAPALRRMAGKSTRAVIN